MAEGIHIFLERVKDMRIEFTNETLKKLIFPLFMEQLLVVLVGIVDTFIVSYVGEYAVSGVSLVNAFNTIFIYLFTAVASGGAVVISQYIGRKQGDIASEASSQLLSFSVLFSFVISSFILLFDEPLMRIVFGAVEVRVMEACLTYLRISVYSFPALAIYNAGAAMYRSFGKTSTTMYISLFSNVINIIGNIIGVFVLKAGVAGVAYPSLIARLFSAITITLLCFSKNNAIYYHIKWIFQWNQKLVSQMLKIAIPNGLESAIFQLVKVGLSSIVALFGTYQIAANGIAQSIWSVSALVGIAMGPVFITVIGQCMGANDSTAAEFYFRKLLRISVVTSMIWNVLLLLITPFILNFYFITEETKRLVFVLVLIHNMGNAIVFPFAEPLGKGLRASGDIKFTTITSIVTTFVRLGVSILLGVQLKMGVIGIAYAMCIDWVVRGSIYWWRFKHKAWKQYKVI